jgi:hypothetical protein
MARHRTNKSAALTPTQLRWMNGEWLLGVDSCVSAEETMQALGLIRNINGKSAALFENHGDPDKFFYRPGMDQPISLEDLEDHKARWLEAGDGSDPYGGESFFVHHYFTDADKQTLWDDFGDKENFKWEPILRRPIPIGASIDAAMVAFSGDGLKPFKIEGEGKPSPMPKTVPVARREMQSVLYVNGDDEVTGYGPG